MIKITNLTICRDFEGITVHGTQSAVYDVPPNLVICAIGSEDTDYLLNCEGNEVAFHITTSEWEDFKENGIHVVGEEM